MVSSGCLPAGVAVLTVDSVGRRPLLLWGVGGMTVALLGLGGSSLALSGSVSTWSSVVALLLYVGAYQVLFQLHTLRGDYKSRDCSCSVCSFERD